MNAVFPNPPLIGTHEVEKISFVDRHISKIAFVVSTLVQCILGPLTSLVGIAIGIVYETQMNRTMRLKPEENRIPVTSAVFAVVGAFASIIKMTPAGAAGGTIFHMIPYLSAFMIGTTASRACKSILYYSSPLG